MVFIIYFARRIVKSQKNIPPIKRSILSIKKIINFFYCKLSNSKFATKMKVSSHPIHL